VCVWGARGLCRVRGAWGGGDVGQDTDLESTISTLYNWNTENDRPSTPPASRAGQAQTPATLEKPAQEVQINRTRPGYAGSLGCTFADNVEEHASIDFENVEEHASSSTADEVIVISDDDESHPDTAPSKPATNAQHAAVRQASIPAAKKPRQFKRAASPGGDDQPRARSKVSDFMSDDEAMLMLDELASTHGEGSRNGQSVSSGSQAASTNGDSISSTQNVPADGSQAEPAGDGDDNDDSDSDDEDPRDKWRRKYDERQNNRRTSSQNLPADSLPASNGAAVPTAASALLTSAGASRPVSKPVVTVAERLAMLQREK